MNISCMKIYFIVTALFFLSAMTKAETVKETNVGTYIAILEGTLGEGGMDSPEFKEYSKRSNANGEAHGGVVLKKYMIKENLGQGGKPDFVLIVEYPSHEAAKKTFSSEEYKAIIPLRNIAFKEVKILFTN